MDTVKLKIELHQKVLKSYIQSLAKENNEALGNTSTYQAITDLEGNHFQLVVMGWHKHKFLYNVLIHLNINFKTGNIWVQQNNTEILIDEDLEKFGIPKSHFVLGFRPAIMREHSKYAVA
ncbi:MAG: element excision factor XisI family protein [Bacteroidota bacterium]